MEAGTVAVEPEDGSMIWSPTWLFTDTDDTAVAAKALPFALFDLSSPSSTSIVGMAGKEVGAISALGCSMRSGSFKGVEG